MASEIKCACLSGNSAIEEPMVSPQELMLFIPSGGGVGCGVSPLAIVREPNSSSAEAVRFGSSCVRKVKSADDAGPTDIVGILSISTLDEDEPVAWKTSSCSPMPI